MKKLYVIKSIIFFFWLFTIAIAQAQTNRQDSIRLRVRQSVSDLYTQIMLVDKNFDIKLIESDAIKNYGETGKQVIWNLKALYYYIDFQKTKKRVSFEEWFKIKKKLNDVYPLFVNVFDLNNDAWMVFQMSSNQMQLESALAWSKKAISKEPTANYYDTYGNLLYKLGLKEEAIKTMEYAIKLSPGNGSLEDVKGSLEKMKRGEKTWINN